MQTSRVQWLDVMKCLGIFAIYLGHFGQAAGYSYDFVFSHHVALFFFAAGCTEAISKSNQNLKAYIAKRTKTILVPYFVFAIFSIFIFALTGNAGPSLIWFEIIAMLKGAVRNSFCSGGLWFLTCLFVTQIIFIFLHKINHKGVILIISLFLFFVVHGVMKPSPISSPRYVYNIDSAFYFLPFYVLGYILFPYIQLLWENLRKYRPAVIFFSLISLLYSALLFFQKDPLILLDTVPVLSIYTPILRALLVIWLYVLLSYYLQEQKFLRSIGQNTLYLCGSEYLATTGVKTFAELLGLSITIASPLSAYIYTAFLIYIANRFMVPVEKNLMGLFFKQK